MDVGLNIADGVRVRPGDKIEQLMKCMDEHKVEYVIPYQNKSGNKVDMIMFMEKCGVELNISDNIIIFIKSNNNESNYIMQLDTEMHPVTALQAIKQNIAEQFNIDTSEIRIDKFDGKSLNSTLSIPIPKTTKKIKMEMLTGANQRVYMHSIALSN